MYLREAPAPVVLDECSKGAVSVGMGERIAFSELTLSQKLSLASLVADFDMEMRDALSAYWDEEIPVGKELVQAVAFQMVEREEVERDILISPREKVHVVDDLSKRMMGLLLTQRKQIKRRRPQTESSPESFEGSRRR